jgi:hypothetical protein
MIFTHRSISFYLYSIHSDKKTAIIGSIIFTRNFLFRNSLNLKNMKTLFSVAACCFMTLSNLSSLSAQCLDGDCKNGRGTYQFDNGNKYVGEFRRSIMQGKGTVYFANGNRYNGDWVGGLREGTGIYTFSNGNVYTGSFKKSRFEGQGTMTFASGSKYIGNWASDQCNGIGTFFFGSGDRYEGSFKNGKFDGQGIMYYKNSERYVGEWAENLRSGKGKLYRSNNTVVEGTWVGGTMTSTNAQNTEGPSSTQTGATQNSTNTNIKLQDCNKDYCRTGMGVFRYGDGSRWEGTFKDGTPEGQGTCFYVNGDKYVGGFERHAPHGEGTMFYKNGRTLAAIWEYGRPVGEITSGSKVNEATVEVDRSPEVKIWAVVVGVGRYKTMPVLKYSDDDAYQYYAFLKSPEGGALPDKQVRVLVDEDATRANIISTLKQVLMKADDNDVIVFYFSGHGLEGAFLPQDYDGINNKLYHNEVKAILEQSKAKHKICVADACHSGSLLAMKQPAVESVLNTYYRAFNDTSGGMALLMSSKGEEYSLEDQGLRSGIFSHYLIRGLKGEADIDGNKIVTVREVYDFVYKNVRTYTSNVQTPTVSGKFDWAMPVAVVR